MSEQHTPPKRPELRAYKVNVSKGDDIPCDADELAVIIQAISTGSQCKIRSGVFNPSYYVSITEDRERIAEIERENSGIYQHNEHEMKYGDGTNYREYKGVEPLRDIFEGLDLTSRMQKIQQGNAPELLN